MPASLSTLALDHIVDHDDRIVRKLPTRLQTEAPRLVSLAAGLGAGIQLAEDYIVGVLDLSTFENASGAQLDQWGDLVLEDRGPLGDADYRRFIRARLRINRWHDAGAVSPTDEMIDIWKILMGAETVFLARLGLGVFELVAVRALPLPVPQVDRAVRSMLDVIPAGCNVVLTEATPPSLGFAGSTLPTLFYSGGLLARRLYP